MKDYPLTIAAGSVDWIDISGANKIYCDTSNVAKFQVRVDNDPHMNFFEGRKYTHTQGFFKRIEIKNTDVVPMTVNLVVGGNDIEDNITKLSGTLNITDITNPVMTTGGTTGALAPASVGLAAVKVLDADATRTGWIAQMLGAGNLYWGFDNTVTAATGMQILSGGDRSWDYRGAIWMISDTAAQDVRIATVST